MDDFILIPSFYFEVEIGGQTVSFKEVNGLEVSLETEEVIEGGNNLYKHHLPVRQSFSKLILAKGVVNESDSFYEWVKEVLLLQETLDNSFGKKLKTILVHLKSPQNGEKIRSWQVVNAYPIKWSVSSLNAMENKITIETVDLAFQYLESIDS